MKRTTRLNTTRHFYYGWIIVGLGLISMAFWFGIRSSFSVFYVALLEEFPWSGGQTAGVQSVVLITYTFLAPLLGGLIDRFGPRRVILPGVLVLTIGLILCATIETLSQFYLLYGILAASGVASIGIVSYSAILAHWFEKRRGLASGLAVSGMGLGTFAFVPLSQRLISLLGWRPTFVVLGGLVFVILLPLSALFLRHKPQDLGLHPDGASEESPVSTQSAISQAIHPPMADRPLKVIVQTGTFWSLVIFPLLALIGVYIVLVHNVKFLVDKGIDPMTAAFIFALAGAVSSLFRIFWGWLSDRIGREITYTLGMLSICLGVASLLLLDLVGKRAFVYSFFIFFGIGWGVTAPMFMASAADLFKGRLFGLIYGIIEGFIGLGAAFGTWIAGVIFDTTQSYRWAFVMAIIVFGLSSVFMWLAAPRRASVNLKPCFK